MGSTTSRPHRSKWVQFFFFFFFFVSDPPSPSHPTLTYVHRTLCRAAVGWFTVGQRVPPGKCAWISHCCITALFTVSHVISHPGCLGLLSAARLPANLSSIITQCFHHTVLKSFFFHILHPCETLWEFHFHVLMKCVIVSRRETLVSHLLLNRIQIWSFFFKKRKKIGSLLP